MLKIETSWKTSIWCWIIWKIGFHCSKVKNTIIIKWNVVIHLIHILWLHFYGFSIWCLFWNFKLILILMCHSKLLGSYVLKLTLLIFGFRSWSFIFYHHNTIISWSYRFFIKYDLIIIIFVLKFYLFLLIFFLLIFFYTIFIWCGLIIFDIVFIWYDLLDISSLISIDGPRLIASVNKFIEFNL